MGKLEEKLLMGGIPSWEIKAYFASIGGKSKDDSLFVGPDWEVMIRPEMTPLGSMVIERTEVIFRVNEEKLEKMLADFRLKFLRAGG